MDISDKIDVLDLAMRALKEHERKLDLLISELQDQVIRKLEYIDVARATEVKNKANVEKISKQTTTHDGHYASEIEVVIRVRLPEDLTRAQ